MAGMGPFGFGGPVGSVGPKGMDLSPWFQTQQLHQQRQRDWQDQLAQQQQMQQFQQTFGLQQTAQDTSRKLAELELNLGQQSDAANRGVRVSELEARNASEEKDRTYQTERDKVTDLRVLDAQGMAQKNYELERDESQRRADEEDRKGEFASLAKVEAEDSKAKAKAAESTTAAVASVWTKNPSLEYRLRQGTLDARDAQMIVDMAVQAGADPAQAAVAVQKFIADKRAEDMERRAFELQERQVKSAEEREKRTQAKGERGEELDADKNDRENAKLDRLIAQDARESAYDARQDEIATILSMISQATNMGDAETAKALMAELSELRKKPLDVAEPAPRAPDSGPAPTPARNRKAPPRLRELRRQASEYWNAMQRKDASPEQAQQWKGDYAAVLQAIDKEFPDAAEYTE